MAYTTISESVEAYDDYLDEFGRAEVAGYNWCASSVLAAMDPCAYKTEWIQWCDAQGIDTDDLEDDYTFDWDR